VQSYICFMLFRSIVTSLILSAIALFFLSGCQDHKDKSTDSFGELDSLQIAADTTMQANLDRSYEFQKTLVQNDTVVYDFTAYDKPKGASSPTWESKFIVIRRTASAQDTIVKDFRSGIVQNIWLSDLDKNGKPEIMFYEYPKASDKGTSHFGFFAYETNGRKNAQKIEANFHDEAQHYRGRDSFFVSQNYLIRRYPYYDKQADSISTGETWQSYRFSNGKLIFEKEKRILQ